ncbi:MAG: S1C family serine protease [Spirochaetales bacterium]
MSTMFTDLSTNLADQVDAIRDSLFCVGPGKATPRTGVIVAQNKLLSLAMSAEVGESVPVHGTRGESAATVTAFDPASGVVLLEGEAFAQPVLLASALPRIGSLAVEVAVPIPGDVEARLAMIRCVGGETRLPGGRKVDSYLQTDASSFRGFAGGAILAPNGELLGISMSTMRREEGYAIPAPVLRAILDQLSAGGNRGMGYLGVTTAVAELPKQRGDQRHGLLVTAVESGSPAANAGIRVGTFLIGIDGTPVSSRDALYDALSSVTDGQRLAVETMNSEGATSSLDVKVVLRR